MQKLISITIVIILAVFFVSACSETDKQPEKSERKEISFWHFWSEPYQREAISKLIAKFEAQSGYKVNVTELSWNDGKTKLMAAFNSNTAPDVLELGSDWVAQFSSSGVLKDLDTLADFTKFIDFTLAPCKWNDKMYALPWITDTRVMFYNKDLMERAGIDTLAPKDIQELMFAAEKVNNLNSEIYGFGANGADQHRLYKKIIPFMWSHGGDIIDEAGNLVLNSKENIAAFYDYVTLAGYGVQETQKQLDAMFAQGKVGFWFSGAWLLNKIQSENPTMRFGVALMPSMVASAGTETSPGISFAGGEYIAVNAKSQHKAAVEFAKFITDGINAIEFCKMIPEAGFPCDKNYFNDEFYQTQPLRAVFAAQLKYAKMTPVHPKWLKMEAIIENALEQVLYAKQSPELALQEAHEETERIIKRAKSRE